MLKYGVDLAEAHSDLFSGRVALVTAPTGLSTTGETTASVLRRCCDLRLLLAPEHGLRGNRAAGEEFGSERDEETGLEVLSLYSGPSKRLPEAAFDRFDTVVYDIQDVGCRYYTFISSLKYILEDCAAHRKRVVVLDRPNPLGARVEGPVLRPECRSFVGCHELPVAYGLTCGEFARMVNASIGCELHVIPCEGWRRDMTFPNWGCQWVKPSPNIPDYETALLYPGTCLLEGTNFSEGRGTEAPFAILGAPFVDEDALCSAVRSLNCPGITAEPLCFVPAASKHQGTECGGIRLNITDESAFRPTHFGIRFISLLQRLYPNELTYTPGENMPFLSQLSGHRLFETGDWNPDTLIEQSERECERFREQAKPYLLGYGELG